MSKRDLETCRNREMILAQAISYLLPSPCGHEMIRVGGDGDGAYLLPDDLQGIAWCISPGVNNFKYFEDQLLETYDICSILVDYTSDPDLFATPLQQGEQVFYKKWLSPHSDPARDMVTLEELIEHHCDKQEDLLLQMDIEGAEWEVLSASSESVLSRFRIVVLELHGLDRLDDLEFATTKVLPALANIYQTHVCVHVHPNNTSYVRNYGVGQPSVPSMLEATFLRRDRMLQGGEVAIPHHLDIINNENLKSVSLDMPWAVNSQSLCASVGMTKLALHDQRLEIKSLEEKIEFLRSGLVYRPGDLRAKSLELLED